MIHVHRATLDDFEELARLNSCARHGASLERGGEIYLLRDARPPPVEQGFRIDVDKPDQLILIASIGAFAIGFSTVTLVPLLDGYRLGDISEIFVEPEARDVGVAEAMMRAILEWAAENHCDGLDARALPGDRQTKNFFESHGLVARSITVHRELRAR